MLRVGLTGGIGSGKSEVSKRLVALGAELIDADLIAREVVRPGTPGLAAIVAEFGEGILLPDGTLDRPALGSIVFADDERRAALNAITHPLIARRSAELLEAAAPGAVVVFDMPLLVEKGLAGLQDVVVVVDVPVEVQVERLMERRGMTEADARARIAAQASREQRRAVATHVIDNSGSLEELDKRVDALWAELTARAASA
ncbi:dephospho-CoA kinase [Actinomadura alba]|uniref:Dephospho-CoA kinase n=1 Tax=Actinomadura alba TaxID=406431 RepID=A0ABR7LWF4_9ACTN|nr:dephospho-CoA kinase [Actinomadura alba]MBC6469174.1 dephospho-CoA kinase [Actinomadura alba]